eukprot:660741-Prorocentrum_lima.AAC.1
MTSSLVGSEMCIRDRAWRHHVLSGAAWLRGPNHEISRVGARTRDGVPGPVSYTHLTLPTICSV